MRALSLMASHRPLRRSLMGECYFMRLMVGANCRRRGPDAPEEDPDYKPGREAGVEEVSAEDEVAV